jgi:phosphatidylinositol-3-phosphatase
VRRRLAAVLTLALLTTGCTGKTARSASTPASSSGRAAGMSQPSSPAPASGRSIPPPGAPSSTSRLPRPDHVVVVVLENHSYSEVIDGSRAPFIASLAAKGAVFTQSFAVTHPSQPNYLALFSGSTQGITDDSCPHTFAGPNLASELTAAKYSFAGYSEGLPGAGFTGCSSGSYARKHSPWVNFADVPASDNLPFTAFPTDYALLPTVSFVIPDLDDDMHDGTIEQADQWLSSHLGGYAAWAPAHRSLLVVTLDEDDYSAGNQIATIITGALVRTGRYSERIDHYRVLRTLTDAYHLAPLGSGSPITDVWSR